MGNLISTQDIPQISFFNKSRILSNCCVKKEYTKCHHCRGKGRILSESSLIKQQIYNICD